jgi:hypothetical protein
MSSLKSDLWGWPLPWREAAIQGLGRIDGPRIRTGLQTAFERIGLLVVQHLNEVGKPVDHGDLAALLEHRGPLPPEFQRKALAELPDDIVYLRGHGYWLKRRP